MLPADVLSEQYREIRGLSVSLLIENGTALAIVALLAVFILYRSSPVSYTHLDVYKRQYMIFPPAAFII